MSARTWSSRAPIASNGSSIPVNGINRAVDPGGELRAHDESATSGRSTSPRIPTTARRCGAAGNARSRAYRSSSSSRPTGRVISPVLAYLDVLDQAWPPDKPAPITIVVLPEYVARHWWERLLLQPDGQAAQAAILGREHTVIADVPYRRD